MSGLSSAPNREDRITPTENRDNARQSGANSAGAAFCSNKKNVTSRSIDTDKTRTENNTLHLKSMKNMPVFIAAMIATHWKIKNGVRLVGWLTRNEK